MALESFLDTLSPENRVILMLLVFRQLWGNRGADRLIGKERARPASESSCNAVWKKEGLCGAVFRCVGKNERQVRHGSDSVRGKKWLDEMGDEPTLYAKVHYGEEPLNEAIYGGGHPFKGSMVVVDGGVPAKHPNAAVIPGFGLDEPPESQDGLLAFAANLGFCARCRYDGDGVMAYPVWVCPTARGKRLKRF